MKITLDLPDFTIDEQHYGPDQGHDPGLCAQCGGERYGHMARLHPLGWVHVDADEPGETACLQKALDGITAAEPATAWTAVARHVARYPSRHNAATIRAVLTELTR